VGKSIVTRAPSAYPKRRTAKTVQIRQLHKWKSPVKFKQNVTGLAVLDSTAVTTDSIACCRLARGGPGVGSVTASSEYQNIILISRSAVTILRPARNIERENENANTRRTSEMRRRTTFILLCFAYCNRCTFDTGVSCRYYRIIYKNTLSGCPCLLAAGVREFRVFDK